MGAWFSSYDKIQELEHELIAQKKINEQLLLEIRQLRDELIHIKTGNKPVGMSFTKISRAKIMEWVDDQLKNSEANIAWMPDYVERQLKTDIFTMLLALIDHILETTKIDFMGHEMRFDIQVARSWD